MTGPVPPAALAAARAAVPFVNGDACRRILEAAAPHFAPELPPIEGEPLTHYWHCWRFPNHHACAVELIEIQQRDNDGLLVRADRAERAARDAKRAPPQKEDS